MSAAVRPVNANCPRCGGPFRCGVSDEHCACFDLQISPALREHVASRYDGCLCIGCLRELNRAEAQTQNPPTPVPE